jgi:hypothetical protein
MNLELYQYAVERPYFGCCAVSELQNLWFIDGACRASLIRQVRWTRAWRSVRGRINIGCWTRVQIDISARISMMSMTVVRWESIDSDLPNESQAWQGTTR